MRGDCKQSDIVTRFHPASSKNIPPTNVSLIIVTEVSSVQDITKQTPASLRASIHNTAFLRQTEDIPLNPHHGTAKTPHAQIFYGCHQSLTLALRCIQTPKQIEIIHHLPEPQSFIKQMDQHVAQLVNNVEVDRGHTHIPFSSGQPDMMGELLFLVLLNPSLQALSI